MLQMSKILCSRNEWKDKAIQRASELREQRKTQRRHLSKIVELKAQIKELKMPVVEKKTKLTTWCWCNYRKHSKREHYAYCW